MAYLAGCALEPARAFGMKKLFKVLLLVNGKLAL